jgi:4-amino-4-deoxy-L-arabinose transferase-like glycosyltransferase
MTGLLWSRRRVHVPALLLVAAVLALMALSVAAIQQSHFFTVDSFATFFATAAILGLAHIAVAGRAIHHLLFGVAFGAALACRINLALLGALYHALLIESWLWLRWLSRAHRRGC